MRRKDGTYHIKVFTMFHRAINQIYRNQVVVNNMYHILSIESVIRFCNFLFSSSLCFVWCDARALTCGGCVRMLFVCSIVRMKRRVKLLSITNKQRHHTCVCVCVRPIYERICFLKYKLNHNRYAMHIKNKTNQSNAKQLNSQTFELFIVREMVSRNQCEFEKCI